MELADCRKRGVTCDADVDNTCSGCARGQSNMCCALRCVDMSCKVEFCFKYVHNTNRQWEVGRFNDAGLTAEVI